MAVITIVLEIWMLTSVTISVLTSHKVRTFLWIVQHFSSYIVLLVVATLILFHSLRILHGKSTSEFGTTILYGIFSLVAIAFGIYISYFDYRKGEQVLTFITMETFVMCLLAWRPVVSILMVTSSYLCFYLVCDATFPTTYATKVNLFTTWIAMTVASISIYNQRKISAVTDEQLESSNMSLVQAAVTDDSTGISNVSYFRGRARQVLHDEDIPFEKLIFLYIDIENFKYYNEKFEFEKANLLLRDFAQYLKVLFPDNLVARVSDDHFMILTNRDDFKEKIEDARSFIKKADSEIHLDIKAGAYRPPSRDTLPILAVDKARYACNSIKKKFNKHFCEFDEEMRREFERKKYIIENLDAAIENGYVKPYYQPVVWAKNGKLCGMEALARWDDPKYGLLPPSAFISVLEEYNKIHLLDLSIVRSVCRDLSEARKNNIPFPSVSINFSRLDFSLVDDIFAEVEKSMNEFALSPDCIHVEITESALNENDKLLHKIMDSFRANGYSLWLDDFGSGYSALNVLKEYDFDMIKLDMKFLSNFSENKKTRPLLKSVVSLASQVHMQTLTEGVETQEEYDFLRQIGCERLQGYLFGKPMPRSELIEKIQNGTYEVGV